MSVSLELLSATIRRGKRDELQLLRDLASGPIGGVREHVSQKELS